MNALLCRILGMGGALLLMFGTVAPIAAVPFRGTFTLLRADREFAAYILVFAVAAFVISLRRRCAWLIVPGVAALTVLGFAAFNFKRQIESAANGFRGIGRGALHEGVKNAVYDSIIMRWGWIPLAVGILFILAAGISASRASK